MSSANILWREKVTLLRKYELLFKFVFKTSEKLAGLFVSLMRVIIRKPSDDRHVITYMYCIKNICKYSLAVKANSNSNLPSNAPKKLAYRYFVSLRAIKNFKFQMFLRMLKKTCISFRFIACNKGT